MHNLKHRSLSVYRFEYLWQDNDQYRRPTKMSAPEYIEHLMAWVQSLTEDESVFPSRTGVPFPKNFAPIVRQIFKRLYRVYAHIYCHHYPVMAGLGLEPHLNTSFKHYVLFIKEYNLAAGRDFWGPLGDLVESMVKVEEEQAEAKDGRPTKDAPLRTIDEPSVPARRDGKEKAGWRERRKEKAVGTGSDSSMPPPPRPREESPSKMRPL